MRLRLSLHALAAVSSLTVFACSFSVGGGGGSGGGDPTGAAGALSSNTVTLVNFDFDGTVESDPATDETKAITAQMFFALGILSTTNSANTQLSDLQLSHVSSTPSGSRKVISYHATLPVGWPKSTPVPTSFSMQLPRRMDEDGQTAFAAKYNDTCLGPSPEGPFWHDYAPTLAGCSISADDAITVAAKISPNTHNTVGVYPEYDRVWSDGLFKIVAVFGKNAPGDNTPDDIGTKQFNTFVSTLKAEFLQSTVTPSGDATGPQVTDVTVEGTRDDGTTVRAVVLLVDDASSTDDTWNARYADATKDADYIVYDGHSGLSVNIRSLETKGSMTPGQYQIIFYNGCNSFAYLDTTLNDRRAAANPDDPKGTKYQDLILNVLPAPFEASDEGDLTLVRALLARDKPQTYNDVFKHINETQEVVVTGEEDNTYQP